MKKMSLTKLALFLLVIVLISESFAFIGSSNMVSAGGITSKIENSVKVGVKFGIDYMWRRMFDALGIPNPPPSQAKYM